MNDLRAWRIYTAIYMRAIRDGRAKLADYLKTRWAREYDQAWWA